ncbi:response regulator transcription factor [Nocardioides sp. InS609-2]|uniref:response regulator transcription factor n=1 Tax=Nocardioides sp. InS609-2 TaxID=2760705 RepID=UPI0020BEF2EC|nr:response regulator transcription factor [Nocardioides sp. InS609-2]
MGHQVVLVEDEEDIAFPLVRTLQREGHDVTWLDSGARVLQLVKERDVDLVILDLGLPDMDGLDVCRQLREQGFDGGIMIVTARAGELDRVVGLDYGADDYLSKPFGLAELQARVRALLRRSLPRETPRAAQSTLRVTGLRIDEGARRVRLDDREIALTTKEFDVLALLASERDQVVSREQLMSDVWDQNWFGSTKTLDVTIGRLRQKLEDAGATDRVVAVRGVGFRLESSSHDA